MQSRRNEEEWKKLVEAASVDVNKAEARSEESRRSAEIRANLATKAMDKLVDQKFTVQANISAFMTHSAYIEMCGMLYKEELSRPDFDTLLKKGLAEAVGDRFNTNPKLGVQAGAALKLSLDRIFEEKGKAILKECPAAAGWSGGYNSWGYCAPHPGYHILKRAKLTSKRMSRAPEALGIIWLRAIP